MLAQAQTCLEAHKVSSDGNGLARRLFPGQQQGIQGGNRIAVRGVALLMSRLRHLQDPA